jgi:hypothetical protein
MKRSIFLLIILSAIIIVKFRENKTQPDVEKANQIDREGSSYYKSGYMYYCEPNYDGRYHEFWKCAILTGECKGEIKSITRQGAWDKHLRECQGCAD